MVTFDIDPTLLNAMMNNVMAISEEKAEDIRHRRYTEDVLIQVSGGVLTMVGVGMFGSGVASCKIDTDPDLNATILVKRDKTRGSKEINAFGYLPDAFKMTQKSGRVHVEVEDGAFISLTQDNELVGEVADTGGESRFHDRILQLCEEYAQQMEMDQLSGVTHGTTKTLDRMGKLVDPSGPKDAVYFRMSQVNKYHMYVEVGPFFQGVLSMVKPAGMEDANKRIDSYWNEGENDDGDAGDDDGADRGDEG